MKEQELRVKKLTKEIDLLSLEIENFERKGGFLIKKLTVFIAVATVIISFSQVFVSQVVAHKELKLKQYENERRYEFDLVNFIVVNQSEIFSLSEERRERVRNIMYTAFPENILKVAFQKLEHTAKDRETQEFWRKSKSLTIGLDEIDTLIQNTQGEREKIKVELWSNRNKGQKIGELLSEANYKVLWIDSKNETPINSIWYDDDTSIENVKLIALFMINSGVGIKQIKKRKNTNGHTQVGSEPFFVSNPKSNITHDEIMRLR